MQFWVWSPRQSWPAWHFTGSQLHFGSQQSMAATLEWYVHMFNFLCLTPVCQTQQGHFFPLDLFKWSTTVDGVFLSADMAFADFPYCGFWTPNLLACRPPRDNLNLVQVVSGRFSGPHKGCMTQCVASPRFRKLLDATKVLLQSRLE